MSTEAIFLYDPTIPALEKEGENPNRMRFYTPTKVIDTLGLGAFNIQQGTLSLHAMAMVRRCTVIKGFINMPEDPIEGILLDGGIIVVDETGEQETIGKEVWTLSGATNSSDPNTILKHVIMGKSKDFAKRVAMIAEGYKIQETRRQKSQSDQIRKARGGAREARYGTFGQGY